MRQIYSSSQLAINYNFTPSQQLQHRHVKIVVSNNNNLMIEIEIFLPITKPKAKICEEFTVLTNSNDSPIPNLLKNRG